MSFIPKSEIFMIVSL